METKRFWKSDPPAFALGRNGADLTWVWTLNVRSVHRDRTADGAPFLLFKIARRDDPHHTTMPIIVCEGRVSSGPATVHTIHNHDCLGQYWFENIEKLLDGTHPYYIIIID